jgi:hypothetical protein
MYESVSKHYTPARVKNAKAKVIEPWFNRFNKTYLRFLPNWSGHNVTASKDNQPNDDMLNLRKKDFPDAEGCRQQLEKAISLARAEKIERYRELWAKVPDDKKIVVEDDMYLYLFGAQTGEKSRLQPDGLRVTIDGTVQRYDCFDRRFREYSYIRWTVKYNPDDLTKALAVNDDGTLRFMLERKYVQPMALADRKEGDAAELERVRKHNYELEADITFRRATARDITQGVLDNPKVNDTLAKFVLCDSRGQHKDRRNELRAAANQIPAQVVMETDEDEGEYEVVFDAKEFRRGYCG